MEEALTFPLTYPWLWIAVWTSAAAAAFQYWFWRQPPWTKVAGFALLSVPIWITFWSFLNSIPILTDSGSFVPARSRYRLSSSYIRGLLIDLGYLGSGLLFWTAHHGWPRTVATLAMRLRKAAPHLFRVPEARSWWLGTLALPALIAATLLLDIVVRNATPQLLNGDESQVWRNMTPYHAFMVSAMAAVTEELVYRVVVFGAAAAALRRFLPNSWAWGTAWVLQAVVFGLAHAGYGTWYHVVSPTLFGLIVGAAAWRWGLWSAIALHFWIDWYGFANFAAGGEYPWLLPVLWAMLVINAGAAIWFVARWGLAARRSAAAR